MKIYQRIEEVITKASVVTTGTFDGVHAGHRAILAKLTESARSEGLDSIVITFDPHPRIALQKDADRLKLLTTLPEKTALLKGLGVDIMLVVPFTREFASTPYAVFVREYLCGGLQARKVVVGFDHHFGKARNGNHLSLLELGKNLGFVVEEAGPETIDGIVVSSTKIRDMLSQGCISTANRMLCSRYLISGTVVKGHNVGSRIGFPTANIVPDDPAKLIPADGVYAVEIQIGESQYQGMCNIGFRPTFNGSHRTIEANIFGFEGNIYGNRIQLFVEGFIRKEKAFPGVDELIAQLHRDREMALKILCR